MFAEYSDTATCASNTLIQMNGFSLNTCFSDGSASDKYTYSNGVVSQTFYSDAACQTLDTNYSPNPETLSTVNNCQGDGYKIIVTNGKKLLIYFIFFY